MNNLTLFVYFADILPRAGDFLIFLAVMAGIGVFPALVATFISTMTEEWGVQKLAKGVVKYTFPAFLALSVVAILIPSKETLYLMAGSEVGETVVTSPEAQIILKDIHEVIRAQLNQLKVQQ